MLWICVLASPNCPGTIISDASELTPAVHIFIWDVLPMIVVGIFTAVVLDIEDHIEVLDARDLEHIQVLSKRRGLIRTGVEAKTYELDMKDKDRKFDEDESSEEDEYQNTEIADNTHYENW